LHLERNPEEEDDRCGELLTAWYKEREEADGSVGELERVEEPGV
jgi:hypothetical protein